MQAKCAIYYLCVVMVCITSSDSSNIDTFEPIMRHSPELNATSETHFPNDLFGYTLVLHQLDEAGGINSTRIVVSAPYGQALGTRLPRMDSTPSTGVIYTCPINPGQCEGLTGDGTGHDRRLYDVDDNDLNQMSDMQGEQKRGQFLGSTLKSTGNTFLVCGHRYLDYGFSFDRNPYGICYFSSRSLSGFQRYLACNTRSRSFFGHGQCQAGTAGDIINGSILLGAPGMFAWRGAVFLRSHTGQTINSDSGVGSGSISWQGYEVVTGRIIPQNLNFIVSVPRFNNYRGRVNIYTSSGPLRPVGNPPLAGYQVGEYYGFSMAAVDLQGQGIDDLLVGAPMYSLTDGPECGRVYVYTNHQGSLSLFTTLEGRIPFGRFGHAMAKLGDINGDLMEDVAISAPFGEQPGTVYIYAGAGTDIIDKNPIQTIIGSSLNLPQLSGLRSLGASLSSNVDVDNNGFNDLAVGAYLSQKIFVLRTRPVAKLEVNLTSDRLVQRSKHCNDQLCFNISTCLMYSGANLQNMLEIKYTLSVNALLMPTKVRLSQADGIMSTDRISGTVTLLKNQQMCILNTTAILDERISDSNQFVIQFTPELEDSRTPNPAWDGNMTISSLDSAPVLCIIGNTSTNTSFEINQMMESLQRRLTPPAIPDDANELCITATSCTDCIQLSPECIWCTQPNYTAVKSGQPYARCVRRDADHECNLSFIEDPIGNTSIIADLPFGGSDFIQISPQHFHVSLRPGQPQNVTVFIRPANNTPLDIYLLMDQSFSMNDDLENLRKLSSQLASVIDTITENFKLGFGSFVDKRLAPYFSLETARLRDPCQEDGVPCEPTYSFRHTLSLTSDSALFTSRIQDEVISGNLDSPEGGLDAMLQVVACQDIIGWRDNARRILVYLSDAGFHFAGDGKLGGVVTPHDGQCYLEQRGNVYEYTMAEKLDYPSIGQISNLLQKFNIIPVFAVEAGAVTFYNSLTQVMPFAHVGTLSADSSNVVNLIHDIYNTISQTVRLIPESIPGVEVEITPLCQNTEGSSCIEVTTGQTVSFNVTLTAQACTDELINGENLTVRIPGYGEFMVELRGVCDNCSCENNPMSNSDFCNGNGDLVCGQCVCYPGWSGSSCGCNSSNPSLLPQCPVGPNGIPCTSPEQGTCDCGICQCIQLDAKRKFFGPTCECDNFRLDRNAANSFCTFTVNFSQSTYSVNENDGKVQIELVLNNALATSMMVRVLTTNGSAIGNEDYSSGPLVVTIPAGQTSASFDIAITDDNLMENNKSFDVIIDPSSLPSIVTVGMPGQATVTIVDDDKEDVVEDCIVTKIQSKIKRNTIRKRITLTFSSDGDPRATYRCKLDNHMFQNCMSPVVWRNVSRGKHTVVIRAFCTNDDGIQTSTVKRKHKFRVQ